MFFKDDNPFADFKNKVEEGHDTKNDKNVNGIDDKSEKKAKKDTSVPKKTPKPQAQKKAKPTGNEGPAVKYTKDTFMAKEITKNSDGSSTEKHYSQMQEASDKEEKKFHKNLDDLVHDTFGKREDEKTCAEKHYKPGKYNGD